MNNDHKNGFSSLFVLFLSILSITSCLELRNADEAGPAALQGKWKLLRVEEVIKTVSPPTYSVSVWIEFNAGQKATSPAVGDVRGFRGEALVNIYGGAFTVQDNGHLTIASVESTERGGPVPYMNFDSYYYEQLSKATSFTFKEQTLVLKTTEGHLLVYTRFGDGE
jgi:heat shock protein HslJ